MIQLLSIFRDFFRFNISFKQLFLSALLFCSFSQVQAYTDPVQIDVLLAHTSATQSWFERSTSRATDMEAMRTELEWMSNQSFSNSDINVRINIIHHFESDFSEQASPKEDLNFLLSRDNPASQQLREIRDLYKADIMVMLVRHQDKKSCGQSVTGAVAGNAISVVEIDCALESFSFAHEIGHLAGAKHQLEHYDQSFIDNYRFGDYAFAYCQPSWRTIMSTSAHSEHGGASSCSDDAVNTRLLYWSNPELYYQGEAMGSEQANNARLWRERGPVLAAFRHL